MTLTLALLVGCGPEKQAADTATDTDTPSETVDEPNTDAPTEDTDPSPTDDPGPESHPAVGSWANPDRVDCVSTESEDWDADGNIDRVEVTTYGGAGEVLRTDTDADVDGNVDFALVHTYGADGLPSAVDHEVDGDLTRVIGYTWDDDGRLVAIEAVGYFVTTYTSDASGSLYGETDYDGDGIADLLTAIIVVDGLTASMTVDVGADGTIEQTTTYAYVDGRMVEMVYEDVSDPAANHTTTWTYDLAGDAVETATDALSDGTIDARTYTDFDDHHRELLRERDDDDDGVIDGRTSWVWDCPA